MLPEQLSITFLVINAMESLNIPYMVGGSLASARYGTPRSTLDADLVAQIEIDDIKPLVEMLEKDFYIDEETITGAVQRKSSFNIIHLATAFKVDIFLMKDRPYDRAQFQRRRLENLANEEEQKAYVSTAEDIVLAKLEWYRMGGMVSDRQWRDILGVLKVQRDKLDLDYTRRWADEIGVADLLEQALKESE